MVASLPTNQSHDVALKIPVGDVGSHVGSTSERVKRNDKLFLGRWLKSVVRQSRLPYHVT